MKKSLQWLAVAMMPVLLVNPASAQDPFAAPKAKKAAAAKTPTLSFYYFDG